LKNNRADQTVILQEGQPLVYGANQQWALEATTDSMQIITSNGETKTRHNSANFMDAMRLARLHYPEFPVPLGVYYQQPRDIYHFPTPISKTKADVNALFRAKATWQQN